eukprot:COSAG02_NODE_2526_length_8605_cov_3.359746_8_plen_424_part_00
MQPTNAPSSTQTRSFCLGSGVGSGAGSGAGSGVGCGAVFSGISGCGSGSGSGCGGEAFSGCTDFGSRSVVGCDGGLGRSEASLAAAVACVALALFAATIAESSLEPGATVAEQLPNRSHWVSGGKKAGAAVASAVFAGDSLSFASLTPVCRVTHLCLARLPDMREEVAAHLGELDLETRSEGRDRAPTCLGRIPERRASRADSLTSQSSSSCSNAASRRPASSVSASQGADAETEVGSPQEKPVWPGGVDDSTEWCQLYGVCPTGTPMLARSGAIPPGHHSAQRQRNFRELRTDDYHRFGQNSASSAESLKNNRLIYVVIREKMQRFARIENLSCWKKAAQDHAQDAQEASLLHVPVATDELFLLISRTEDATDQGPWRRRRAGGARHNEHARTYSYYGVLDLPVGTRTGSETRAAWRSTAAA